MRLSEACCSHAFPFLFSFMLAIFLSLSHLFLPFCLSFLRGLFPTAFFPSCHLSSLVENPRTQVRMHFLLLLNMHMLCVHTLHYVYFFLHRKPPLTANWLWPNRLACWSCNPTVGGLSLQLENQGLFLRSLIFSLSTSHNDAGCVQKLRFKKKIKNKTEAGESCHVNVMQFLQLRQWEVCSTCKW